MSTIFCKIEFEKNKNKQKDAGVGPFFKKRTKMNPIKMTAMLSSFFLLDSLTVREGGGAVTETTPGEAADTVATRGDLDSASLSDFSSMLFVFSTTTFSPLIWSRTWGQDQRQ